MAAPVYKNSSLLGTIAPTPRTPPAQQSGIYAWVERTVGGLFSGWSKQGNEPPNPQHHLTHEGQYLAMSQLHLTAPPILSPHMLENLQHIDLSHNQLTTVPSIRAAQELKILDLSHNNLTTLPDFIFELPRTCSVRVLNNSFTSEYMERVLARIERVRRTDRQRGPTIEMSSREGAVYDNVSSTIPQMPQQSSVPLARGPSHASAQSSRSRSISTEPSPTVMQNLSAQKAAQQHPLWALGRSPSHRTPPFVSARESDEEEADILTPLPSISSSVQSSAHSSFAVPRSRAINMAAAIGASVSPQEADEPPFVEAEADEPPFVEAEAEKVRERFGELLELAQEYWATEGAAEKQAFLDKEENKALKQFMLAHAIALKDVVDFSSASKVLMQLFNKERN